MGKTHTHTHTHTRTTARTHAHHRTHARTPHTHTTMATVMQTTTTTTTTEVPGSKRHFWDREPLLSLRRVLWVVLGGWMFFLVFFFVGVAFAITIVGMPMAYEFFKFARFLLLPVGYRAISRSGRSKNPLRRPRDTACTVANVLWLIFFGWWLALMLVVLMVIQAVTIIGLPLVVEFPKLMKFIMWPFGKKIISKKSYRAGVAAGAAQTATVVPGTTVVTSV